MARRVWRYRYDFGAPLLDPSDWFEVTGDFRSPAELAEFLLYEIGGEYMDIEVINPLGEHYKASAWQVSKVESEFRPLAEE